MGKHRSEVRYVLCVKNDGYPVSLEVRKLYQTMDDPAARKHGLIRIIDESEEDYLYPQDYFVSIELPKAAERALAVGT